MLNTIFEQIWAKKFVFLGTFFVVFTLSYIILVAMDYLPEPPAGEAEQNANTEEMFDLNSSQAAVPVEESADVITTNTSEDVVVSSPSVTPIESEGDPATSEVSENLVNGQEDSQAIEDSGNAVFPVSIHIEKLGKTVSVLNPTSRTIVDLDNALLEGVVRHPDSANLAQEGNVFILGHSSYLPQVFNKNFQAFNGIQNLAWGDTIEVYSEDAAYKYRVEKVYRAKAQEVTVPIAGAGNKLTLATCNSFGSTDDRYIVEAKRIEVRKL